MSGTPQGKRTCKWLAVKKAIEREIVCGNIAAGSQIPTLDQLVVKYSIGRTTAQRVLDELSKDGLIIRRVGKGCYVRPFVRERIKESHREEAREELAQSVSYALDVGVSASDIESIVAETIANVL